MATLKITIFKVKVLKDGRHKIRIADQSENRGSPKSRGHVKST